MERMECTRQERLNCVGVGYYDALYQYLGRYVLYQYFFLSRADILWKIKLSENHTRIQLITNPAEVAENHLAIQKMAATLC